MPNVMVALQSLADAHAVQ